MRRFSAVRLAGLALDAGRSAAPSPLEASHG